MLFFLLFSPRFFGLFFEKRVELMNYHEMNKTLTNSIHESSSPPNSKKEQKKQEEKNYI